MINGRKNTVQAVDMMYYWNVVLCSSSEQLKCNKKHVWDACISCRIYIRRCKEKVVDGYPPL